MKTLNHYTIFIKAAIILFILCMIASINVNACKAINKTTGKQCLVKSKTEYCYFHNPNKITCNANTVNGTKCKMGVKAQGMKCYHHNKQ